MRPDIKVDQPSINLDAQWLRRLANQALVVTNDKTSARFQLIAQRLESMDERLLALSNFDLGVQAERDRIYGRTNLPTAEVPDLQDAVARSGVKPRRVVREAPPKYPQLAGLKIDLTKLKETAK